MTAVPGTDVTSYTWWRCEPRRLRRDQEEITSRFPELQWSAEAAGAWEGRLPRWPFDRPEPAHLTGWIGEQGLLLHLQYSQAYPMQAPRIFPMDPEPEPVEWTQHRWHVNGDGSLCLLREEAAWTGRGSVIDLLLKAAGWRIEHALMKHETIEQMTDSGIVDDDSLDRFLAQPPQPGRSTDPHPQTAESGGPAC
jgi:hypothetical protein